MTTPILIVGAGLSGLSAAWHCHKLGLNFRLIEARDRLGGRAFTQQSPNGDLDLGPSWVWHGQPYVGQLLQHFAIRSFDQYCDGALLHQTADGQIHRNEHLKPMQYAQRMKGGIGSLVSAIAKDLPPDNIQLNTKLSAVSLEGSQAVVRLSSENQVESLKVDRVALAVPPRLIENIDFQPALPADLNRYLLETPTWMAAQAKFFALYDQPFWRSSGLSGDAFSTTGALAEVHDASSAHLFDSQQIDDNACYALFGFVRLHAQERAELGSLELQSQCVKHLIELFGAQAANPKQTVLQDWSTESFTASPADSQALLQHPNYGPAPNAADSWVQFIDFISAETSSQSGGLIEGALQRGAQFAQSCSTSLNRV